MNLSPSPNNSAPPSPRPAAANTTSNSSNSTSNAVNPSTAAASSVPSHLVSSDIATKQSNQESYYSRLLEERRDKKELQQQLIAERGLKAELQELLRSSEAQCAASKGEIAALKENFDSAVEAAKAQLQAELDLKFEALQKDLSVTEARHIAIELAREKEKNRAMEETLKIKHLEAMKSEQLKFKEATNAMAAENAKLQAENDSLMEYKLSAQAQINSLSEDKRKMFVRLQLTQFAHKSAQIYKRLLKYVCVNQFVQRCKIGKSLLAINEKLVKSIGEIKKNCESKEFDEFTQLGGSGNRKLKQTEKQQQEQLGDENTQNQSNASNDSAAVCESASSSASSSAAAAAVSASADSLSSSSSSSSSSSVRPSFIRPQNEVSGWVANSASLMKKLKLNERNYSAYFKQSHTRKKSVINNYSMINNRKNSTADSSSAAGGELNLTASTVPSLRFHLQTRPDSTPIPLFDQPIYRHFLSANDFQEFFDHFAELDSILTLWSDEFISREKFYREQNNFLFAELNKTNGELMGIKQIRDELNEKINELHEEINSLRQSNGMENQIENSNANSSLANAGNSNSHDSPTRQSHLQSQIVGLRESLNISQAELNRVKSILSQLLSASREDRITAAIRSSRELERGWSQDYHQRIPGWMPIKQRINLINEQNDEKEKEKLPTIQSKSTNVNATANGEIDERKNSIDSPNNSTPPLPILSVLSPRRPTVNISLSPFPSPYAYSQLPNKSRSPRKHRETNEKQKTTNQQL